MTASSQPARDGRAVSGRHVSASATASDAASGPLATVCGAFVHRFTAGAHGSLLSARSVAAVVSAPATPWTVAHQAPLSMRFSRQEHWSGLPFPPPGDLPNPGIEPSSPALTGGFFTPTEPQGKPQHNVINYTKFSSKCWVLFLTPLKFSVIEFINKEAVVCGQSSK